jgi:hypothetical protein
MGEKRSGQGQHNLACVKIHFFKELMVLQHFLKTKPIWKMPFRNLFDNLQGLSFEVVELETIKYAQIRLWNYSSSFYVLYNTFSCKNKVFRDHL